MMKQPILIAALIVWSGVCIAVDVPVITDAPVSVIRCHVDDDPVQDEIHLYHFQNKSTDGSFKSLAVFLKKDGENLVPVYSFAWTSPFPNMMAVAQCAVDDEPNSSLLMFLLYSAGAPTHRSN